MTPLQADAMARSLSINKKGDILRWDILFKRDRLE